MKKELQQQLFDKYPTVFLDRNKSMRVTLICCGLEIADGWYALMDECCAKLVQIEQETGLITKAVQVKEKFGTLRFYITSDHDSSLVAFATNTRYWLQNIVEWVSRIAKWSEELTPWQEWFRELQSRDKKLLQGAKLEEFLCRIEQSPTSTQSLFSVKSYRASTSRPWCFSHDFP